MQIADLRSQISNLKSEISNLRFPIRNPQSAIRNLNSPLAALLLLILACRSQPAPPSNAGDAAFELPSLNLTDLSPPLRARIERAEETVRQSPDSPDALGELGIQYFVHDFPLAAAKCFERAGRLQPAEMRWHYYAGVAHEKIEDIHRARAAYERAIAADPSYAPAFNRLGQLLIEDDPERAGRLFETAARLRPNDALAHFGLGKAAQAAGRNDDAPAHFTEAVRLFPKYKDAHYALAMLHRAAGRHPEAERHLAEHRNGAKPPLDDDPLRVKLMTEERGAPTLIKRATEILERGDLRTAESLLAAALENDNSGWYAHNSMGVLRARQGRLPEAIDHFQQALQARPDYVECRSNLALALEHSNRPGEALREYQAVLQIDPDDPETLERLSTLLMRAGRLDAAVQHLQRVIALNPVDGSLHRMLGEIYTHQNKDALAIQHLRKSIELAPGRSRAHYTMGVLLNRANDMPGARREWELAAAGQPVLPEAFMTLASVAADAGEQQRYLRAGIEAAPDSPLLASALAHFLISTKDESRRDPAAALSLAERSCALTSNQNPWFLDTLAQAYAANHRFADAARAQQQAIDLLAATREGAPKEFTARLEAFQNAKSP